MTNTRATPTRSLTRLERALVVCVPYLLRLLYATWRVRVINDGGWRGLRKGRKPIMFTLWHGHLLPLLLRHRKEGIAVLISEHHDGELIAQTAERFGFRTIRGSTTRGAARALLALTQALEQGQEVAVTPDGPRGPARQHAPGALVAAHRAHVPVITCGVYARRAWRLKSWDAFMIPKPFTQVTFAYGDPTFVEGEDARAAAEQRERFELALNAASAQAQSASLRGEQAR